MEKGKREWREISPCTGRTVSPVREKKTEPGKKFARLGQKGTVAKPLDGGALTRWGARTPARGPATAPGPRCFTVVAR